VLRDLYVHSIAASVTDSIETILLPSIQFCLSDSTIIFMGTFDQNRVFYESVRLKGRPLNMSEMCPVSPVFLFHKAGAM
jgi:hypothetical protein